ncbi:hypothetical protein ACM66B_006879 [Microbotryomycetes sp. NB124-2]
MLDKLVQHLLEEMAMNGVSYSQLVQLVQSFYAPATGPADEPGPSTNALPIVQNVDHAFMAFVWNTLAHEQDVRVGYLGQPPAEGADDDEDDEMDQDEHERDDDDTSDAGKKKKMKQKKGKGKQKDKKPKKVVGPFEDLDDDERQLPHTDLLEKYGDNLRVAADPESAWQAITGSSGRPSSLTPPVYAMLQLVSQGRGDGATTIAIGHTLGFDQKSAFHVVKTALNLGLVKKIRALDQGSWTSRIIHNRYLSISPHWAIHNKNDDEDNSAKADQALLSDEEDALTFGARPWTRMSALDSKHLDTNPDLVRRRIVKALKQREGHVMPHSHIAPSVGFYSYTRKELRRFNALISRMCNDHILEKTIVKYSDEGMDVEEDDEDGAGGVRSVRLKDSDAKSISKTFNGQDDDEADWEDMPRALAFVPIERQVIDIVAQSGSEGVLISDLSHALGNLSSRALTTILARVMRPEAVQPELADMEIVSIDENEGRERRTRYFTVGGYLKKIGNDSALKAEVEKHSIKLQQDCVGRFPRLDPKQFCKTPKERRSTVNKIDVRTFRKMGKAVKVQRFDPWTGATAQPAKRGRPTLSSIAKRPQAAKADESESEDSDVSVQVEPKQPTKGKKYKNVDELGNPIKGRPRKKAAKLDKDGNPILTYYERRKLENERRVSMGLEPITKGPLLKLAQREQMADPSGQDGAAAAEVTSSNANAVASGSGSGQSGVGTRRSSPRKRGRAPSASASASADDVDVDELAGDGNDKTEEPRQQEADASATASPTPQTLTPAKRGRGRPRKHPRVEPAASVEPPAQSAQPGSSSAVNAQASTSGVALDTPGASATQADKSTEIPVKRGRGRPRKRPLSEADALADVEQPATQDAQPSAPIEVAVPAEPPAKRGRGRPRKAPAPVVILPAPLSNPQRATTQARDEEMALETAVSPQRAAPTNSNETPRVADPAGTADASEPASATGQDPISEIAHPDGNTFTPASRRAPRKRTKLNLTSRARQAEILAWLEHEGGVAELTGKTAVYVHEHTLEHREDPTKQVTRMDRDVLLDEVDDMVKHDKLKKTTVALVSGRRDLIILPGLDMESDAVKTFLKQLNVNPRSKKPTLPVISALPADAKSGQASAFAVPSLDDDEDKIRAYFKSNQTVLSHMYGCAYGRVARARHLHKLLIEYVASHDVDGVCLSKEPDMISPDYTSTVIKLGDYLKIVPLAVDSEELEEFCADEDNLKLSLKDLPKNILRLVSPTSHARQKSLQRVIDVLFLLEIVKPLVPAPTTDLTQAATGAFQRPKRLTAATHWELAASVPLYKYSQYAPKLIEVASCSTPEQVDAYWKTLRAACLIKDDAQTIPLQHDRFPPFLPGNKSFNGIMSSGTKWYSGSKLVGPQTDFIFQAMKAKPNLQQDKTEIARLARLVCAPEAAVTRWISSKLRELRKMEAGAVDVQHEEVGEDHEEADFGALTGVEFNIEGLRRTREVLLDEGRKQEFHAMIEQFSKDHSGFELPERTFQFLQERYSRLRNPIEADKVDYELRLWFERPIDVLRKTTIPRKYQPPPPKSSNNALLRPGRQIGNRKTHVPQGPAAGSETGDVGDAPEESAVRRKSTMSAEEHERLHKLYYGHDRQHDFVTGPVKAPAKDMKRMSRSQFSEEQDELIIQAGAILKARARLSGQRNNWIPFEQLFSEFESKQIMRRFKTLAGMKEHKTFVENLEEEWLQMLRARTETSGLPKDDGSEQLDFDITEHVRAMRAKVDMKALRRAGPRMVVQRDSGQAAIRLPSTLTELYDKYTCKPATKSPDITSRWPKYDKLAVSNASREEELVDAPFSSPRLNLVSPVPRDLRLAADAIKVTTCTSQDIFTTDCGTAYLKPVLNNLPAAASYLEQHAVILKRGKENRRLPGRVYLMNDRFEHQLQSSLTTNRIRQAIEIEDTVNEDSLEWPIMSEDGDMIALFRMFNDNKVELSIDTSVSEHLRDPTDYQTRLKGDDEAVENLVEVRMRTDTTSAIQDGNSLVKPPLLPTYDVPDNAVLARAVEELSQNLSPDGVAAQPLLQALLQAGRDGLALAQIKNIVSYSSTATFEGVLKLLLEREQPLAFVAGDAAVSLVHIEFLKHWTMPSVVYEVETFEKEVAVAMDLPVKKPRKRKQDTPPVPAQQDEQGMPRTEMVTMRIRKLLEDQVGKRLFPTVWTSLYGGANGDMWRKTLSWIQTALSSRSHATAQQLFIHSDSSSLLTLHEIVLALQHLWAHGIVKMSSSKKLVRGVEEEREDVRQGAAIDWTDARWSLNGSWYRA